MGRYGAPRPVRYVVGGLVGASVFAATSVAMFSLAASAGSSSDLLGGLTNSVSNVTGGLLNTVGNTVNNLAGPQGTVCQLLCNVGSSGTAQQPNNNPLGSTLNCLSGASCSVTDPLPATNRSTNGSTSTGGNTTVLPAQNPPPASSAPAAHSAVPSDPPALSAPPGVTAPNGSLVPPPPSSINLPSATSGINFGKAPFLWPLFLGLDVLGAGAVVLALRKTWSRPVAD